MKRYELSQWTMTPYYAYSPFRLNNAETDIPNSGILPPIPAHVPGSIYRDLEAAGVIEDPFFEMNSLKAEWVPAHWWSYFTRVTLPTPEPGERLELVLEGIDTMGHIYFNGTVIGHTDNMYVPFVYDVTDMVREGENTVGVVIENAPDEMGQIGHTSQTFTQKARFNYKWDWCTRMISMGLYRPAYIRTWREVRVDELYFHPIGCHGDAEVTVRLAGDSSNCTVRVEIGGVCQELPVRGCRAATRLHVDNVRLWYPVDAGEQALYDLRLTVLKNGEEKESEVRQVGFKQFELTENEAAPVGAFPYVFTCNGKKIYAKGVNLTPIDMCCYNDPERLERQMTMLRDAHINLVRVWGGGVIEEESFYRLCDRLGIMVWQEFIQSSSGIDNIPSKREIFLERSHATAVWATKTLRNHVSLTVWSGGNELMDKDGVPSDFADRNIAELLGVVRTYSPHVPMLPTSASGPLEFGNPDDPGNNHDIHGNWKYIGTEAHYSYFNRIDSLFHSEFGVDGMSSLETLRLFLSDAHLQPSSMSKDYVWRHHGEWWDTSWRDNAIFGEPKTIEEQIVRSQFVQAEGLRYAIEANRRRAFHNSGSIIWQANELYPNVSSTALIDYTLRPKPVYWQIAKAFAPLNVSVRYDRLVWSRGDKLTAEVFVTMDADEQDIEVGYGFDGDARHATVRCGGGRSVPVGRLETVVEGDFVDIVLTAQAADGQTYENRIRLLVRREDGLCSDEGLAEVYPEKG